MKIKISILLFILAPCFMIAQESNLGSWYMYFGNKKLNDNWNIHHEIQYRNYDAIGDLEQLLLRTGIGYNLTENNNNVMFGYGYMSSKNYLSDSDEKQTVEEHRIFQQYQTTQKLNRLNIKHRYRVEQRFVEEDFKWRFRYFLSMSLPINNKGMVDKTFYASAYNEIFLNAKSSVFDRNRLYGGLGYKINKSVRFEIGYMNQFFESSGRDQINTMVFVNF